jgi:hypothetical protein
MAPQSKKGLDLTKPIGTEPGSRDVIVFRGGITNHHAGSKEWRALVDRRKLEYIFAGSRKTKQAIVVECMREHKAKGGRYVGAWKGQLYEATYEKAYNKTIQRLREQNARFLQKHFMFLDLGTDDTLITEDIEEQHSIFLGPSDPLTLADNSDDGPAYGDECPSYDEDLASVLPPLPESLDEFLPVYLRID